MRNPKLRSRVSTRLAVLLATTFALTTVVVPSAMAAPAECSDALSVSGPNTVYLIEGQPVATHVFTVDCDAPVTWEVGGDVPEGITFDEATARFIGTPAGTESGWFTLTATNAHGSGEIGGELHMLNTELSISGPEGSAIDQAALEHGSVFELHLSDLPAGTELSALWDGVTPIGSVRDESFVIEAAVPGVAERGDHFIEVAFHLPSGQRYAARIHVTVIDSELTGPAAIFPIVGVDTAYQYQGLDVGPDAVFSLQGELPAGMVFDAEAVTISGAPEQATESSVMIAIVVVDGPGMEVAIDVLPAEAVQFPAFFITPQIGGDLGALAALLAAHRSAEDEIRQAEIDRLLRERQREAANGAAREIPIGPHPGTGEPTIVLGSELENQKEQNRLLIEAAKRAAEKAKQEQLKALEEERKRKQEVEKNKQELRKIQNEKLMDELKKRLEEQRAANEKAAEDAKKRAEEAYKKKLESDAAREAFEKRKEELEKRKERNPLPDGTTVRAELHSTPVLLAQTAVSGTGGFLIRTQIPTGTPPGAHHLVVTYTLPDGTVHTQSMAVTVVDPNVLPATGANPAPIGYLGGVSLLLGLAALLMRRRLSKPVAVR